jgi:hypothetical protein
VKCGLASQPFQVDQAVPLQTADDGAGEQCAELVDVAVTDKGRCPYLCSSSWDRPRIKMAFERSAAPVQLSPWACTPAGSDMTFRSPLAAAVVDSEAFAGMNKGTCTSDGTNVGDDDRLTPGRRARLSPCGDQGDTSGPDLKGRGPSRRRPSAREALHGLSIHVRECHTGEKL